MSEARGSAKISNLTDLFAAAFRIETDAVERYTLMAQQMETHNNLELAEIFRDLARAEGIHAEEIRRLAGDIDVAGRAQQSRHFGRGESPEEADLGATHYLMTPWQALQLALEAEKRALEYFTSIVNKATDPKVKTLAAELVEEEAEHVNLVHRLIHRYPPPPDSWQDDMDPPSSQG